MSAGPVIKWVGGKTKLLPDLLARLPQEYTRYYEPFAGGAALFFKLAQPGAVLSDANADLIGMYRAVAADPEAVIALLQGHAQKHSKEHYYAVRAEWNSEGFSEYATSLTARAAAFIYMNKAGFNGLYRVNADGAMNVAWGKRPAYVPDVDGIRAAAAVLARAELRIGDYRAVVDDAQPGDLVYMDPPYDETWTAYTASQFDMIDQAQIAYTAKCLASRGVHVVVSNADTPRVRELYAGMQIDIVMAPRAVNRDGAGRGKVPEVIVTAGHLFGTGVAIEPAPRRTEQLWLLGAP